MDDGYAAHAPVGTFLANAFGLHDVHGNVWEWCEDVYSSYGKTPIDGSANKRGSSVRVRRGGGWDYDAFRCRSAVRIGNLPDYRDGTLGLRSACSLPE